MTTVLYAGASIFSSVCRNKLPRERFRSLTLNGHAPIEDAITTAASKTCMTDAGTYLSYKISKEQERLFGPADASTEKTRSNR